MEEKLSLGHLAALFTVVNWGTTFIATKLLLEAFTPIEILLFRFVLGFLVLWLVCPRRLKVGDWHREAVFAAAGLTGVCLYYLLENIALTFSTASNVGVIVSASPLFAALFTLLLSRGKERPRWSFLLGFVVSMGGICLISFNGSQLSLDPRGDLLAVLAAVVWAVYSLLTKRIGGYGWNVIQTTRRIFGWGILFMIPAAAVMDFRLGLERLRANPDVDWRGLDAVPGNPALSVAPWRPCPIDAWRLEKTALREALEAENRRALREGRRHFDPKAESLPPFPGWPTP